MPDPLGNSDVKLVGGVGVRGATHVLSPNTEPLRRNEKSDVLKPARRAKRYRYVILSRVETVFATALCASFHSKGPPRQKKRRALLYRRGPY